MSALPGRSDYDTRVMNAIYYYFYDRVTETEPCKSEHFPVPSFYL